MTDADTTTSARPTWAAPVIVAGLVGVGAISGFLVGSRSGPAGLVYVALAVALVHGLGSLASP
jgi:hypothetical protein